MRSTFIEYFKQARALGMSAYETDFMSDHWLPTPALANNTAGLPRYLAGLAAAGAAAGTALSQSIAHAASRTNRHSSKPDGDCGKVGKSLEVTPSPVISRGETSEVLEPIEATFDAVAMSVGFRIVRNDDLA